ncbi:MAG: type II toxin-antitoxin system PemK/MazF family toxin [Gemmataceae bacterium]|nr:type II toxin-antitoxin system PemK/MazF family toxin [Gemmataceae bacterium]
MPRGDVVLVRFPHPSGIRGKRRPAVVVQSDAYTGLVRTIVVAAMTTNLALRGDPACLLIDPGTPDGQLTGVGITSVLSCLELAQVYADQADQVLGRLSPALLQQPDACLKVALDLR